MLMNTLSALTPKIDLLPYVIFLITTLGLIDRPLSRVIVPVNSILFEEREEHPLSLF
jgi:p-aminobenzoyl-glutamate transporter AbgT